MDVYGQHLTPHGANWQLSRLCDNRATLTCYTPALPVEQDLECIKLHFPLFLAGEMSLIEVHEFFTANCTQHLRYASLWSTDMVLATNWLDGSDLRQIKKCPERPRNFSCRKTAEQMWVNDPSEKISRWRGIRDYKDNSQAIKPFRQNRTAMKPSSSGI